MQNRVDTPRIPSCSLSASPAVIPWNSLLHVEDGCLRDDPRPGRCYHRLELPVWSESDDAKTTVKLELDEAMVDDLAVDLSVGNRSTSLSSTLCRLFQTSTEALQANDSFNNST